MIESKGNKELEKQIDLYANGKLSADQIDELWVELIQDGYYLDYMKSVVNLKAVIDQKKADQPKSRMYPLKRISQYAAAAAVILIVGIVGVLNYSSNGETMISPISDIGLDVVRDVNGVSDEITSDVIRRAIQLATEGEVEEAILILEHELEESTDPQHTADIALSLGSIHYNAGNYTTAIEKFEIVNEQKEIRLLTMEKAYWFLGNAYLQLDRLDDAEDSFQKAYDLNGAYSRVAKTYVDALNNVR